TSGFLNFLLLFGQGEVNGHSTDPIRSCATSNESRIALCFAQCGEFRCLIRSEPQPTPRRCDPINVSSRALRSPGGTSGLHQRPRLARISVTPYGWTGGCEPARERV